MYAIQVGTLIILLSLVALAILHAVVVNPIIKNIDKSFGKINEIFFDYQDDCYVLIKSSLKTAIANPFISSFICKSLLLVLIGMCMSFKCRKGWYLLWIILFSLCQGVGALILLLLLPKIEKPVSQFDQGCKMESKVCSAFSTDNLKKNAKMYLKN